MRWTCVSTEMPTILSKQTLRQMSAIFGPTPGSAVSASSVSGTVESCSSTRRRVVALMNFTLLLWKPTARISSSSSSSGVARMFAIVRPCARSFAIVAALTVSFVCDESMSETNTW